MYKSLKNFAWCIDFQKVNFEKDEEFDENKAKHKEIIEEMISHGYAEKISPEKKEKVLQDMTKVELIKFAQEKFNVSISGNKEEIISQIEKLEEEFGIEDNEE
mgnify:CR=1 FL=1|jgi:hypothetical protein